MVRLNSPLAVGAIGLVVLGALALAFLRLQISDGDGPSEPPTAAIVDQASLTQPNDDVVEKATKLLERSGYTVDYYGGEQVTVDFYRDLPELGYDMLILRTHSGLVGGGDGDAFLFTSEPYSRTAHQDDQQARRLIKASYRTSFGDDLTVAVRDIPTYFGVPAEFISSAMTGNFDGATIIVMGCNGLTSNTLAEALVERGAGDVMSWDGLVSAEHTDAATERLLQLLLEAGLSPSDAVAVTMEDVGPDPTYGSALVSYTP